MRIADRLGSYGMAELLKAGRLPTTLAARYYNDLRLHLSEEQISAYFEGEARGELDQNWLFYPCFHCWPSKRTEAAIEQKILSLYNHIWFDGVTHVVLDLRGREFVDGNYALFNHDLASAIAFIIARRSNLCRLFFGKEEMVCSTRHARDVYEALVYARGAAYKPRNKTEVPDRLIIITNKREEPYNLYPARFSVVIRFAGYEDVTETDDYLVVQGNHPRLAEQVFLLEK